MPYVKENNEFRFTPDEWLTAKQIKSFFSNLTQTRRLNSNSTTHKNISNQKNVPSRQIFNSSKKVEPNINEYKLILEDKDEVNLYIENVDEMQQNISNLNFENESDDEENEKDFDATMAVMDMEDMLTSAKNVLIHK